MEDRRIAKTKQALREAFVRLLKKKNLADITVSELTREANIDRRTFYLHYNNIYDIIDEIDAAAVQIIENAVRNIPVNSREFFEALTKIMVTNMDYYEVIVPDSGYYSLEHRCKVILRDALIEYFGKTANLDPVRLEFYAEYGAAGIMSIYTHWMRHGRPVSLEELTDIAYQSTIVDWQTLAENNYR